MNNEQKENIRFAVNKVAQGYMDDKWDEILDSCTDTDEELEWANSHLYIGEVDFQAE